MEIKIRGNKRKEESSNVKKKIIRVFFTNWLCKKKATQKKILQKKTKLIAAKQNSS